jgi:prepilin-type N-terminal cleavage/methylation domain-containing protein
MHNKKAFTLTELIIALGIIGTIAALPVPTLIKNINRKILATQLKNTVGSIQQLVTDEMVIKKTKNLSDTDFGNSESLLNGHFEIAGPCDDDNKCWASNYRFINPINNGAGITVSSEIYSKRLKNGVTIGYTLAQGDSNEEPKASNGEGAFGIFYVDTNGTDDPNIIGRDMFMFYLTPKGKLLGIDEERSCYDPFFADVRAGLSCFTKLVNNNWKMPDNDEDY